MLALVPFLGTFIAASLAAPASTSSPLPIILWHGLGDNYDADGIKSVGDVANEVWPGAFFYSIRLDEDPNGDRRASFFGNLTEQVQKVCDDLATHPIIRTAPAVDAIGFSQGGVFLRAVVERCNIPPVRSLVTMGSPHNGIADFAGCGATDWLCKGAMALLKGNTWGTFVQSRLVPAQYYRSTDIETGEPTDEYLENSNFLADINNERELKNTTYALNLASLHKFVMYEFEQDETVVPKESTLFAQVNLTSGHVTPLRNRTIYQEDWLGLKTLDERGGLIFDKAPGRHMNITDDLLRSAFKAHFGPLKKRKPSSTQSVLSENYEL